MLKLVDGPNAHFAVETRGCIRPGAYIRFERNCSPGKRAAHTWDKKGSAHLYHPGAAFGLTRATALTNFSARSNL